MRDALLATGFAVPRLRPDLVSRGRLRERLDEQVSQRVVLTCALQVRP